MVLSTLLPFEVWFAFSSVLAYSLLFLGALHFESAISFFRGLKQKFLFFTIAKKRAYKKKMYQRKFYAFFSLKHSYFLKDLTFISCLIFFKGFVSSPFLLGILICFSIRFDHGLSLSVFYWLLLFVSLTVFLPSVQKYIKTTYGSRCFRYLGWNPGFAPMQGGKTIINAGKGILTLGGADAVLSVLVHTGETAYLKHCHNTNVDAWEKHIERFPDNKEIHPGPFKAKPLTSILKRTMSNFGFDLKTVFGASTTPTEAPKVETKFNASGKNTK